MRLYIGALLCAPKRGAYHADRETDEKRWKPMKASIVGGFMRGTGWARACGQRGEGGREQGRGRSGNPICRHFCADIVRLFISTPNEIPRETDRRGAGGVWEKEGAALYCRIGILPRIRRRAFSALFFFFTFIARHEDGCTTRRCIGHTPIQREGLGIVSSVCAANFARFHATVSHDTVVVNFQLTDDSRSVSEYRCEFTPFSRGPAGCIRWLDVVENHTLYRTFCRVCLHSRKMRDSTARVPLTTRNI